MKKSTSSRKSPASSLQKAHAKTLASVESHPRSSRSRRLTPPLPELDEPVALAVVHTPTTPNQKQEDLHLQSYCQVLCNLQKGQPFN